MEKKFTKGKWEANIIDVVDYKLVAASTESKVICHCLTNDFEESKANVMLICAAPEMFEMLNKILNIEDHAFTLNGFDVKRLKSEINEVLKKAIG